MSSATSLFYEKLEGFADFAEFSHPRWYQALPDDWYVVITDVRGSTRAIEAGKYKQVNGVGVASIVAVLNAVRPLRIPFVFGGDGATACFPAAVLDEVRPALVAARKMSKEQFQLELRIGIVPMNEIRQRGHDVLVGKHQPHAYYQQAMFLGNGLGFAEQLVKDSAPDNPWLVREQLCAGSNIFEGFECRWNEIPSPHDESIALLVQAQGEDVAENDRLYEDILTEIRVIYGEEARYHPLREENLSLTPSFRLLSVEAGVRTAFTGLMERLKYLFKLQVLRLVGIWFMKRDVVTDATRWGDYKHNLVANTDFRKFDEMLRMVIAGTKNQREQLRAVLEGYRDRGEIVFGIHAAPAALITCIVTNYDKDHVHFLDGANGGYAMAARELKQQLKDAVS
jgi:hypothetical protein